MDKIKKKDKNGGEKPELTYISGGNVNRGSYPLEAEKLPASSQWQHKMRL